MTEELQRIAIAETKRKALAMAKKEHGDTWTYYVHEEKKVDLKKRHYFIARYWNDVDNQLEVFPEYKKQIKYGTEKSADVELAKIIKKSKNDCWQIFWIDTDRDDRNYLSR